MENRNELLLSFEDYNRLVEIVFLYRAENLSQLMSELDRATVISADEMPQTVVKMNSTVVFRDLDTAEEFEVTLVFPEKSDLERKKISVLAPLGSALIGLSEGQSIRWKMPSGKIRKIRVLRILKDQNAQDARSL